MQTVPEKLKTPLVELLLSIADDKLILGHQDADWTGLAPILEEDIAFSSLAQDDLAHASAVYEFVCGLTGDDPNRLAFGRRPGEYRCCELVMLRDEFDWAVAIVRQFFCNHFEQLRLARLTHSAHKPLADLAKRMFAEERLAIGHADQWLIRLGDAGDDARERVEAALGKVAPVTASLFEPTADVQSLEQAGAYPPLSMPMYEQWADSVTNVLEAGSFHIDLPDPAPAGTGGRSGNHPEHFRTLWEEMTEVYRVEPEAAW